jgi:hypothetical protein
MKNDSTIQVQIKPPVAVPHLTACNHALIFTIKAGLAGIASGRYDTN